MDSRARMLFVLLLGSISGVVLILCAEDIGWLVDEIFAVIVSILFFSPVLTAVFDMKPPREWIVVFVIGGLLTVIFIWLYYGFNLHNIIEMGFRIVLFSAISSVGGWAATKLEDIVPPN